MKPITYCSIAIAGCVGAYLVGRFHGDGDESLFHRAGEEAYEQTKIGETELIVQGGGAEGSRLLDLSESNQALSETIIELETELTELREVHKRVAVKHDVLTRPRRGFLQLGFSSQSSRLPRITEETYEYLQLEPEKESRLRELNAAIIEDLISWELSKVSNIQTEGNSVSIEIPAMTREEADQRLHYRETIRGIVDEVDFDMIDRSMTNALDDVLRDRVITIELDEETAMKFYTIESLSYDEEGNVVGTGRSSGGGDQLERYQHIFGEFGSR